LEVIRALVSGVFFHEHLAEYVFLLGDDPDIDETSLDYNRVDQTPA
jgi:hypothetical protein